MGYRPRAYIGIVLSLYLLIFLQAPCLADDAQTLFRQGYEAAMMRQWQVSEDLYTRSIEKDPNNAEVLFQRAVAREMLKKYEEASQDYRKALLLKPDYYLAWEYLGKLYEAYGQYDNAIRCYESALKLVKDAKWKGIVRHWISNAKKLKKKSTKRKKRKAARTENLY